MKTEIPGDYQMTFQEAIKLYYSLSKDDLYQFANKLREFYFDKNIETCVIMNARSGRCSEDCKWCSQSIHYKTDINCYDLVSGEDALKEANNAESSGVNCFSLVTSGRTVSTKDFDNIVEIYKQMKGHSKIKLCASLGLVNESQLERLASVGLRRYHCNLESAPSFFSQLCTTHNIEDKLKTLASAKNVGLEICCGGIIGMGETMEQRIEMAVKIREIGADSIPVNILQPIQGTPLSNISPLTDEEIMDTFAMFRIVNPKAQIRFAAGRQSIKHIEEKVMKCGVSAALVGDMLTTIGSNIKEDFEIFRERGYKLNEYAHEN